ncbi:uncharacterized protein CEXT_736981 [Caerostris extrusa]|uniref:Uncharacterized protein n=1 Tax=Caerostris extrusa TaxID=172846 RepID=A0AAV4TDV1_CAEEX|nr:uncharacterized protein CEXT_736981 [Caerostris extrusa]
MKKGLLEGKTRKKYPIKHAARKLSVQMVDELSRRRAETGNLFIDEVIDIFARNPAFDPYPLQNVEFNFQRIVLFLNVTLDVQLFDGCMEGLETLYRHGYCTSREKKGRVYFHATLSSGPLNLKFKGKLTFLLCLRPTFNLVVSCSNLQVYMHFSVDIDSGKDGTLHKLYIKNLSDLEVNLEGLWLFTNSFNLISNTMINYFKDLISREIENRLRITFSKT